MLTTKRPNMLLMPPSHSVPPPERRSAAMGGIPDVQKDATVRAADEVVARRFCYRGHTQSFDQGVVDWTCRPLGNADWTLDLNRHHFFVTLGRAYWYTGDARYAWLNTVMAVGEGRAVPGAVEYQVYECIGG